MREWIIWYDDIMSEHISGELVRCKDCKHRPKYDGPNHIVFPNGICPCQCEDCYYDWMPSDDWFCADGERRTE